MRPFSSRDRPQTPPSHNSTLMLRRILPLPTFRDRQIPDYPINLDPPDNISIDELNRLLTALSEIFPAHDRRLCRDAILYTSRYYYGSRLDEAVNFVSTMTHGLPLRPPSPLQPWERFRSRSYKTAVTEML